MDITKDAKEINHFSHKSHPLKLIDWETILGSSFDSHAGGGGEKPNVIDCYACRKPISSGFVYGCIQCHHIMHKACAQLPDTINLPSLYVQPLALYDWASSKSRSWFCEVCRTRNKFKGFCYFFKNPKDNIGLTACLDCCFVEIAHKAEADAINEAARIKVEHEGHPQHTLTLQLRPGSFRCDACKTKDEGLFYLCDSCDFWIHKTCVSLEPTVNLPDHHNHPLVLVYSLPEKFFKFSYYCEFCGKYIRQNDWLYHCANCRYFSHIKCALNAERPSTPRDGPSTSTVNEDENGLLHFPMSDAFTDPLKRLHFENGAQDGDEKSNINHWSHPHPLIIIVKAQVNMYGSSDPIEVCHGCVRPLTLPYYTCKDGCSFTLHKYCAELPRELKHPLHLGHSLDLRLPCWSYVGCNSCNSNGNGFVYQCLTCKFFLDVNCAFMPRTIKHKSHKHPLIQVIDPLPLCNACEKWSKCMSYACKACNFILSMHCATRLPNSLAHRYCKGHEIPLTYPPVMDHPEDFFCDICETEMHPKFPLYYCNKCKNSFHLTCISRGNRYDNMIIEGSINVFYHKHPLTYVRRKKTPKYVCSNCNQDINGYLILECRARVCSFSICYECHLKVSNRNQEVKRGCVIM